MCTKFCAYKVKKRNPNGPHLEGSSPSTRPSMTFTAAEVSAAADVIFSLVVSFAWQKKRCHKNVAKKTCHFLAIKCVICFANRIWHHNLTLSETTISSVCHLSSLLSWQDLDRRSAWPPSNMPLTLDLTSSTNRSIWAPEHFLQLPLSVFAR